MDQQFLFSLDKETNPTYQTLPNVFKEHFHNGEEYIFIHGNNRKRYICLVKNDGNKIHLHGDEWAKFVEDNVPAHITTLHFVKEGETTFYVTGYDKVGIEGPGYERRIVGNRVARCLVKRTTEGQILPGDFLQDILKDTFKIIANGRRVKVKHERVQLNENSKERSNRLFGSGWDKLIADLEIDVGQLMVFTNLGDYNLNLALFFTNGRCLYEENILPTMLRLPSREIPPYAIKDKRSKHICSWKGHDSHDNENNVFYAELNGPVSDCYQLTIPVEYCDPHMMHTYGKALLMHDNERFPVNVKMVFDNSQPGRTNHVKMTGNWRKFGNMCGFKQPKMMRFKMMNTSVEVIEGKEVRIARFHVC
ncbi:DNA-binding pseudobarrel domain-containing protein [Artemisia annua]|uniref:DNA-binding pseudobarrel domain-containing protein n=1 Tax=Artemisia annua TaxID=35608 RepID=A0A2U1KC07_ARTAN|nr:DNA-binding pseudobarrel domain-containing protein [Artemisia annua]